MKNANRFLAVFLALSMTVSPVATYGASGEEVGGTEKEVSEAEKKEAAPPEENSGMESGVSIGKEKVSEKAAPSPEEKAQETSEQEKSSSEEGKGLESAGEEPSGEPTVGETEDAAGNNQKDNSGKKEEASSLGKQPEASDQEESTPEGKEPGNSDKKEEAPSGKKEPDTSDKNEEDPSGGKQPDASGKKKNTKKDPKKIFSASSMTVKEKDGRITVTLTIKDSSYNKIYLGNRKDEKTPVVKGTLDGQGGCTFVFEIEKKQLGQKVSFVPWDAETKQWYVEKDLFLTMPDSAEGEDVSEDPEKDLDTDREGTGEDVSEDAEKDLDTDSEETDEDPSGEPEDIPDADSDGNGEDTSVDPEEVPDVENEESPEMDSEPDEGISEGESIGETQEEIADAQEDLDETADAPDGWEDLDETTDASDAQEDLEGSADAPDGREDLRESEEVSDEEAVLEDETFLKEAGGPVTDMKVVKKEDLTEYDLFRIASFTTERKEDAIAVTLATSDGNYNGIYLGEKEDESKVPVIEGMVNDLGGFTFSFQVPLDAKGQYIPIVVRKTDGEWYVEQDLLIGIPEPETSPEPTQTPPEPQVAPDGTYHLPEEGAVTGEDMFRVIDCTLVSVEGKMTAVITMSGTGYDYLFLGTAEDAAEAEKSQWIPVKEILEDYEGSDGVRQDRHTFEIPVDLLNVPIAIAAHAEEEDSWFSYSITFLSEKLEGGETTVTPTPSGTPEGTPTPEPTGTPEGTPTPEPTGTPEGTPTPEPTGTPEGTPTPEPTGIPEGTPTPEPTGTPEGTPTPEPTETPEVTPTPEPTETPEVTPTPEPTETPEVTPTPEPTGTPTPTPTLKPTATPTPKPTATPTPTLTPKPTATATPAPKPTATPKATPAPKPTATPKATPTPKPTGTPKATPTPADSSAAALVDGVYSPDSFSWSGGTGRVSLSCQEVIVRGGQAYAVIQFDSPSYQYVKVGERKYYGTVSGENSSFEIPVKLNANNRILGMTTAMSQEHEIEYSIYVGLEAAGKAEESDLSEENMTVPAGELEKLENAPEIPGLLYRGTLRTEYAEYYRLHYYEDEFVLLEINVARDTGRTDVDENGEVRIETPSENPDITLEEEASEEEASEEDALEVEASEEEASEVEASEESSSLYGKTWLRYLIVPKDQEVPAGLEKEMMIIRQPVEHAYVASANALKILERLDALGSVAALGFDRENCPSEAAVQAMDEGNMMFAGTWEDPQFKDLVACGSDLAIVPGEILPGEGEDEASQGQAQRMKALGEQLLLLNIPMIIDRSADEKEKLGQYEWCSVYGAIFGYEETARSLYDRAAEALGGGTDEEG